MPSPSNNNKRSGSGKGGGREAAQDLSVGTGIAKLIEQVTEGKTSRLEELLTRLREGAEVTPQEDGGLVISRRNGQLLHDLMHRLADYVKLQGRAIDRSNVGPLPHPKSVELLCAALTNLIEIVKERDSVIHRSATAAAEHLSRANESETKLRAAQRETRVTTELAESLKRTNETLERQLSDASQLVASLTAKDSELTERVRSRDAIISEKDAALVRSSKRVRELVAELGELQARFAAQSARMTTVTAVSSPVSPPAPAHVPAPEKPAELNPADLLAQVEASPAMRALLRNYMSPGQRIRTARELKADPDLQFLVLFDHDEARSVVKAWNECWQEMWTKGSPFAADNEQRLAPVNTIFRQRLTDEIELAEAFSGFSPIPILGATATRSIIERVTLSDELIEAMQRQLGYDPRFLALLISAKTGFEYLVD